MTQRLDSDIRKGDRVLLTADTGIGVTVKAGSIGTVTHVAEEWVKVRWECEVTYPNYQGVSVMFVAVDPYFLCHAPALEVN